MWIWFSYRSGSDGFEREAHSSLIFLVSQTRLNFCQRIQRNFNMRRGELLSLLFLSSFALLSAVHAVNLDCEFEERNLTFASGSSCKVENLIIIYPNESITTVNGKPGALPDVKVLDITSQTVWFLPKGLETLFPNLEGIQIFGSGLKLIEQNDIKSLSKLRDLELPYNQLETIESDLFDFNSELQSINFNGNEIKFVGENVLEPLQKLERANFGNNACIDKAVEDQSELSTIIELLESKCKIKGKDVSAMALEIRELKTKLQASEIGLNVCDENLNSATKNMFLKWNDLEAPTKKIDFICRQYVEGCLAADLNIGFRNSSIRNVNGEEGKMVGLDKKRKLKIERQRTLFLPINIGQIFPLLTELVVTNSGLFVIDSTVFDGMKFLKVLDLKHNKVHQIMSSTFEDLETLSELDLSFNRIESVEDEAFNGLTKLYQLKLNDNLLSSIKADAFGGLESLRELWLQNNKLNSIGPNLLSSLPKLFTVDLTNNICINVSHPTTALSEIEDKIIANCGASMMIRCNLSHGITISFELCRADALTIENPKTKISKIVDLSSEDDEIITNVTIFAVIDQSMKFIPLKLSELFPELEKLVIVRSELSAILKDDLRGFSVLKDVVIQDNDLSIIEEGAFDDLPQLEHLDLSSNNIKSLPVNAFHNSGFLKTLFLSSNQLVALTGDLLSHMNEIIEFRADGNKLEKIDVNFRHLVNVTSVDLRGNVCIDMKFDKTDESSKNFFELSGEIYIKCASDE